MRHAKQQDVTFGGAALFKWQMQITVLDSQITYVKVKVQISSKLKFAKTHISSGFSSYSKKFAKIRNTVCMAVSTALPGCSAITEQPKSCLSKLNI